MDLHKIKHLYKAGFSAEVIADKTGATVSEVNDYISSVDGTLVGAEAMAEIAEIIKGNKDAKPMMNKALLIGVARAEDMLLNSPLNPAQVKMLCGALSGLYQTAYPNKDNTLVQVNVGNKEETKKALLEMREEYLKGKKND